VPRIAVGIPRTRQGASRKEGGFGMGIGGEDEGPKKTGVAGGKGHCVTNEKAGFQVRFNPQV
jgi:hypothetical protein